VLLLDPHVRGHLAAADGLEVLHPEDGVEPQLVEVAQLDLVAPRLELVDVRPAHPNVERLGVGVGEDDEVALALMDGGVGPRVEVSGVGLIKGWVYPAPLEEVKLRAQ